MVSVVIPAYNEEKGIAKCLDALVAQKTKERFEVIVVDNASTDNTSKIVKKYKSKLSLRLVEEKKKGIGQARFAGFSKAKGDIIMSIDADTIAPSRWIDKMVKHFEKKEVAAVTGPFWVSDCSKLTNTFVNKAQLIDVFFWKTVLGHPWLWGLNFAIRADVYKKSGGFDKKLKAMEDCSLTSRVKKYGKIVHARDVWVKTSGRRFKKGILSGLWSYHKATILAFVFRNKEKVDFEDRR